MIYSVCSQQFPIVYEVQDFASAPFQAIASCQGAVSWATLGLMYPLVNIQKAIENGPVEIVDLASYKVDLSMVFC